jgi:hypothetical protein
MTELLEARTVNRSDKDESFGFAERPTKVTHAAPALKEARTQT